MLIPLKLPKMESNTALKSNPRIVISPERPTTALDHGPGRTMRVDCGLVISGQLDANLLEEKAWELVRQWPELATRVREVKPGQFDTVSSATDEAISFESRKWDQKTLSEVYPAALFQYRPRTFPTKITSYTSSTNEARELFSWNTLPIQTYSNKNIPSMTFRVTILKDATLIGIIVPHIMVDGAALGHIVKAYAALVRGETIESRTETDPAVYHPPIKQKEFDQSASPSKISSLKMSDFWSTSVVVTILALIEGLYNAWWAGSYQTAYHIPSAKLDDLKQEARMKVATEGTHPEGLPVSKLDVALAYTLKLISYTHVSKNPDQSISVMYAHDIRSYLANLPSKYLHNAWIMTYMNWKSVKQVQNASLVDLAIGIRKRVNEQRPPEEVKKQLDFFEKARYQAAAIPYDGNARVDISSWVGMGLESLTWTQSEGKYGPDGFSEEYSPSSEKADLSQVVSDDSATLVSMECSNTSKEDELPGPYGETIAVVPKMRYPFGMAINNQAVFHNDRTGEGLFVFATVRKGWWERAWREANVAEL